jgi:putative hydrolase of the HAD superfamily
MRYTTIFFDLDDTLYPVEAGLWEAIRNRMSQYMAERMGLPAEQIDALRKHYLETYGTTLRGLQHNYHIDTDDYLAYVHDLPLEKYIHPDPVVRKMLLDLPLQRWIFTNADSHHAQRVLTVLELEGCFQGVIDVRAIGFLNKPDPKAYQRALEIAGASDPRACVLLDDAARNLEPARQMGFTTVLVNPTYQNNSAQYHIHSLRELPKVLPELWLE